MPTRPRSSLIPFGPYDSVVGFVPLFHHSISITAIADTKHRFTVNTIFMFRKPLASKSHTKLRSSDARKLRADLLSSFPTLSDATLSSVFPPKTDVFIDKVQVKISSAAIYSVDGCPICIEFQKKLIPSVYMCWKIPDLLPNVTTHNYVLGKVFGGADLMLPGLILPTEGYPKVQQGDAIGICLHSSKTVLAVGISEVSQDQVNNMNEKKGKAVRVIHTYKDSLWAFGDKSNPPDVNADEVQAEEMEDTGEETIESQLESTSIDEHQSQPQVNDGAEVLATSSSQLSTVSTEDMDLLLKLSLLHAIKFKIPDSAENFPISSSVMYSTYMIPSRIVGTTLDLKKSSYKKLAKFLKAMEKQNLLKLKDTKTDVVVVSVNRSHNEIVSFQPRKTAEDSESVKSNSASPNSKSANKSSTGGTGKDEIKVSELFKAGSKVAEILKFVEASVQGLYTGIDIRNAVNNYIKDNNLIDTRNQKFVKIDAHLCDAILSKSEYSTVDKLPRDQIIRRLVDNMTPYHILHLPNCEPVVKKGLPKPVAITVESRQGRKTVTLVRNLELFQLNPDELVKDFSVKCASSCTINDIPGPGKEKMVEIQIQGSKVKEVIEVLGRFGIGAKWTEVTDKLKGKGKGR
ncbi:hypothetical protein BKA69DRAFT_1129219 [Paraphysoderma sedebokerense]|nr:hypothetical protein BKA69DRAFT_1129219 [Paraphysoderma sedebokerense]